jgi:hypothetical protein
MKGLTDWASRGPTVWPGDRLCQRLPLSRRWPSLAPHRATGNKANLSEDGPSYLTNLLAGVIRADADTSPKRQRGEGSAGIDHRGPGRPLRDMLGFRLLHHLRSRGQNQGGRAHSALEPVIRRQLYSLQPR